MGFDVQWANPTASGAAAAAAGQGQFKLRRRDQNREDAKFLLQLAQRDQQVQDQQALQYLQGNQRQALAYDRLALDDQQQQDYLANQQFLAAQQDAAQQQLAAQRDQFALARDAQDFDQQIGVFGLEQQAKTAQALDQQASDSLKAIRQTNLSPEGNRVHAELRGALRAIQSAPLRDDAKQQALGQWFQNFEKADIGQYEVKEPSADEWWQQTTRTDPDGTVFGKDRAGMPRKLKDAPFVPLTPEETEAATHTYPDGTRLFINPRTGKETVIQASRAKEEEQQSGVPRLTPEQHVKMVESRERMLIAQWQAENSAIPVDPVTQKPVREMQPIGEYIDQRLPGMIERYKKSIGDPETKTMTLTNLDPSMAPHPATAPAGGPGDQSPSMAVEQNQYEQNQYRPGPNAQQPAIDVGVQADAGPQEVPPQIIGPNGLGEYARVNPDRSVTIISADEARRAQQAPKGVSLTGESIAGAGTEDARFDLSDLDDESAMHTVKAAPTGAVFIDDDGRRWVK